MATWPLEAWYRVVVISYQSQAEPAAHKEKTGLGRWRAVTRCRTIGMNIHNQTHGDQLGCRQNRPISGTTSLGIQ